MRIFFMGGKRVGCGCLEYLFRSGHEVVGVAVNPSDRAPDRWYPSAAEAAESHGVPVSEWENVNSEEAVEAVRSLAPEMIVVVYFDQILKRPLRSIPRRGAINLHLALAEEYRGCYPTTWAILNGEERTGVTLHKIDETIDGGPVFAERVVAIESGDTGRSLYEKCTDLGIRTFEDSFEAIARGEIPPRPQRSSKSKYYKREFPSRTIDFGRTGREAYDQIRAMIFEPFPPPCLYIGAEKYEIRKAKPCGSA